MSSDIAVPQSQIDKYKSRISYLERENNELRASKLQLVMSTAIEIDRLRQYIYSIQQKRPIHPKNTEIDEKEEESLVITPAITPAMVAVCEHCGSATKVENNYFITVSSAGGPNQGSGPGGVYDRNIISVANVSNEEIEDDRINEEKDNYHAESDYYNEEDDGKQGSLDDNMSSDDDDHDVVNDYSSDDHANTIINNYITPGRVSIISTNDSFVHTRGMSNTNLPSFDNNQSMGEHADIPLPDNFMDDSFVICDFCTSNLPLQFVRKYPDTMQCSKCCAFFEFIFLCNECGKCVCSECYEYEAKMQSIDRITNNFNTNKYMDSTNGNIDSHKLILFQQRVNDESASMLNKVIAEISERLKINEFSLKLCYLICWFMDDLDLCLMLPDVSYSAELFDIYWCLSPQKISFQKKFGFSDIHLFHSLKWANTNKNNTWSVKQVIDDDIMIENYLSKNYQQITFDTFMDKLAKHMNETNTQYSRLLDILKAVTLKNNINICEQLEYNQFAWRELGGPPSVCSKGIYFVWNVPVLQRSYCFNVDNRILEEQF